MKKYIFLLFLLFLVGCNKQENTQILLLESNLDQVNSTSYLKILNSNLNSVKDIPISANGLEKLYVDNDNIHIFGKYNSKAIQIHEEKVSIKSSEYPHPLIENFLGTGNMIVYNYYQNN